MKNSELKTKKMSLANIEGKLSVTEMEQIMAGSFFGWGEIYPLDCIDGEQPIMQNYYAFWMVVDSRYLYSVVC
ncbi:MAG: hypothetical protein KA210_05115 [Bacteroidia bacterium]|nr:hypothetical protein [Bacteroidia bacterium]